MIKESQKRIKTYANELNNLKPLLVGQGLIVNGWQHNGKTLVSEKVFISDHQGKDVSKSAKEPVCFTAFGTVKKKDASLGSYTSSYNIKIADLIN